MLLTGSWGGVEIQDGEVHLWGVPQGSQFGATYGGRSLAWFDSAGEVR
jgi:hypothetical protein